MPPSINDPLKKASSTSTDTNFEEAASEKENAMHALFLEELADLYDAEKQLTRALPEMADAAESEQLRDAFDAHLTETKEHVSRLEQIMTDLGEGMKDKPCPAMQGLVKEAQELMKEEKDSPVLDAALIAAAQKVEHYEIASYGTLCAWAKQMGHGEALSLLEETLEEEEAADEKLTSIAESEANAPGEKSPAEDK